MQRLATTQARLKDLEVVAQKRKERTLNPVGRGRTWPAGWIGTLPSNMGKSRSESPERYQLTHIPRSGSHTG